MRLAVDIEANGLENPDTIHCIVAKDLDTKDRYVYRNPENARELLVNADLVVGHNFIPYDARVLKDVAGIRIDPERTLDTLVVSRVVDYLRPGGHSLAEWGNSLGIQKLYSEVTSEFYEQWSPELQERCVSDVDITEAVYHKLLPYITSKRWQRAILIEHKVALITRDLNLNGFGYNLDKARLLFDKLSKELESLDLEIKTSFVPRLKFIREVLPRETKHGTIARNSIPRNLGDDLTSYSPGAAFSYCEWQEFNPGSPRQIVERLNEAGWKPVNKTKGHLELLKDRKPDPVRLRYFNTYGWRVDEDNLRTLPETAPEGARKLVERLLLASRVSDLSEQISLVRPSNGEWRIHGNFNGIGAWTGRLSHSKPNTANIPTRKPQDTPKIAELNDEMRTLWVAATGHLLIGVDADQIQLRVLAHYMRDQAFIDALEKGDKSVGTDVHSLNVKAIGPSCKGRRDAKTFIYAWLLGAGVARVAEILGCNFSEAKDARSRFIEYYPGLKRVRNIDIPRDARRGYFEGLDGRLVRIYGDDEDERRHFALGGYLQNGEKVVMAYATDIWQTRLRKEKIPYKLVNWVHDEWQLEVIRDHDLAVYISSVVAESLYLAGRELGTICEMRGSVNNGHDKLAIGDNWLLTH